MREREPSEHCQFRSKLIDARIAELGDWRGKTLAQIRTLIKEAVPEVSEEWKWRGTPMWEHNGMLCTGESPRKGQAQASKESRES